MTYTRLTYNHSRKTIFCVGKGCKYIFINFPFLSSFFSFCPIQGHPTKASSIHLDTCRTTWIKERFNKGPIQNAYLSFYMPFFLQLRFPSFRHQSFESTPYRIYSYQGHIACHSVVTGTMEIQQLLITSQTYQLLKLMMKEEKPTCIIFEFSFLSCLSPSYSPNLHSML